MKHEITSMNTKKMLAASLKKAMECKPLSKITVSEIITDCGVNRKTFYYHFENIYALLKWMLEQEAIDVVKKMDLLADYEDAIAFVMDYIDENEIVLGNIYHSLGQNELSRFLHADFIELYDFVIEQAANAAHVTVPQDFKDFLSKFYTSAIVGILEEWIEHKPSRNREKTIQYLSLIFRRSITHILQDAKI